MNEFVTVSASSYDPASLATKLTEKAADGWTVVAIVPTGGDVTAFLSREASASDAAASAPMADMAPVAAAPVEAAAVETTPEPVLQSMTPEPAASEPAGWAVAPDPAPAPVVEPAPRSSAPATVIAGIGDYSSAQTTAAAQPVAAQPAAAYTPAPAAAATPSVPAGWYADPAGRFDLRYWDGTTWTEHVSRAGQQYTDAPVA
ncbi:MAG: hypothetical protein JWM34_1327 [Ilumatobacteraceae bacterium]|nr:hypothetical protein [Ilumatobacteraceae bacterium]